MQRPQVAGEGAASIAAENSGRSPDADAAIAAEAARNASLAAGLSPQQAAETSAAAADREAANLAEAAGASPAEVAAEADKAAQQTAVSAGMSQQNAAATATAVAGQDGTGGNGP